MSDIRRPGPIRWVLYANGAGLPAEHRTWVLRDVSTRSWQVRHFARTAVQLAPIAVLLYIVIPGPAWVRAMAVLAGMILGFFYSLAYMYESAEHRVAKAGFAVGTAARTRNDANHDQNTARQRRYEERWR